MQLTLNTIQKLTDRRNADNANSGDTSGEVGSGSATSVTTNLGDLPVVGGFLDGAVLTTAYGENDPINSC